MASSTTIANPTPIFREYIGPKPYPVRLRDFPDIVDPNIREFHFIIAFASERYDEKGRGTGTFYENWNVPPIDAEKIRRVKHEHANAKVVISIGGRGSNYPFNPAAPETWPTTVSASLITIINDHLEGLIDGIDIHYDTIASDVDVFVDCIGRLINNLKNERHLFSIAPSHSVNNYYSRLYAAYGNDIDWVNYEFYTHNIANAGDFVELYHQLEKVYGHKLLAGFSTDQADDDHLPLGVFYQACERLITSGELPGIFIWNANDSQVEQRAQELLTRRN